MKAKYFIRLIVSVSFMHSQLVQAQSNNSTTNLPSQFLQETAATTTTTTTTSTSTLPTIATIQDLAIENNKSNKGGIMIAQAIFVACSIKAAIEFSKKNYGKAAMWAAGAVAAKQMANNMADAANASMPAFQAVTVDTPDMNIPNPEVKAPVVGGPQAATASDGQLNPDIPTIPKVDQERIKRTIADLKKQGWNIDEKKGTVKTPDGKKLDTKSFESPKSMAKAGVSPSFIKEFSAMQKAAATKALAAQSKSVDGGEGAFGDSVGGGGGRAPGLAGSADGLGGYGGAAPAAAPGADRNPSQVAGMATNYNGEKIGVAGDSLFHMIDRRYELHQKKGSFLAP